MKEALGGGGGAGLSERVSRLGRPLNTPMRGFLSWVNWDVGGTISRAGPQTERKGEGAGPQHAFTRCPLLLTMAVTDQPPHARHLPFSAVTACTQRHEPSPVGCRGILSQQ